MVECIHMKYIIKPTDGITPLRIALFTLFELVAVTGIVTSSMTGQVLLTALNIATVFVGFMLLPSPKTAWQNRYDTSIVDIVGSLANWAYFALAMPLLVILLKSPYNPAVLYWPTLAICLGTGLGVTLEKARHKEMDGKRALRTAVDESVDRIEVDPASALSMDAHEAAYEETKRLRDDLYARWENVKLTTPRKIALIRHHVAPEAATSREVRSLSDDDLAAYKGLYGLSEGLQKAI